MPDVETPSLNSDAELLWIAIEPWSLSDNGLQGLFARGRYRGDCLQTSALRWFETVREETEAAVTTMRARLDAVEAKARHQAPLVDRRPDHRGRCITSADGDKR